MIAAHEPRVWTALLIGALAISAMWRSGALVRLGFAERTSSDAGAVAQLAALANDPSVGQLARARLMEIAPARDARRRESDVSGLLSRTPLSSAMWLELARARFAGGAASDSIFGALAMSQLTGPNEGMVMAGRAVFALPLWRLASAKMRKAIVRDLVGGWIEMKEARRMLLQMLLGEARAETRMELRDELAGYGADGATIISRLGLTQ